MRVWPPIAVAHFGDAFKKAATVYGEPYETSTHCEFSVVARLTACLTVEREGFFFEG